MKKASMAVLAALLLSTTAWAQTLPVLETGVKSRQIMHRTFPVSRGPLLLLGAHETDFSSLLVDPQEIKVIEAYKDSAILASMGHKAQNGILLIELKHKKTLLKLEDVLDYFEVPKPQRQMRVLLNKQPLNPHRFLADVKRIEKIEVITQDKTNSMRLGWDENEQFLNIVTADSKSSN